MIQVMVRVWVIKAFRKSIDIYARVGAFDFDLRIRSIVMIHWQKYISHCRVWVVVFSRRTRNRCVFVKFVFSRDMIAHHRVNFHFAQKAATSLEDPEQQHCRRNGHRDVDAFLDTTENRDQYSGEEDEDFQGRYPPKLVDYVRRSD